MVSQQLVKESFYKEAFAESLTREGNLWLKDLREKAFAYFTQNGFPVAKSEEWKYTNITSLVNDKWSVADSHLNSAESIAPFIFDESKESVLVFTNGIFNKTLSNLNA